MCCDLWIVWCKISCSSSLWIRFSISSLSLDSSDNLLLCISSWLLVTTNWKLKYPEMVYCNKGPTVQVSMYQGSQMCEVPLTCPIVMVTYQHVAFLHPACANWRIVTWHFKKVYSNIPSLQRPWVGIFWAGHWASHPPSSSEILWALQDAAVWGGCPFDPVSSRQETPNSSLGWGHILRRR